MKAKDLAEKLLENPEFEVFIGGSHEDFIYEIESVKLKSSSDLDENELEINKLSNDQKILTICQNFGNVGKDRIPETIDDIYQDLIDDISSIVNSSMEVLKFSELEIIVDGVKLLVKYFPNGGTHVIEGRWMRSLSVPECLAVLKQTMFQMKKRRQESLENLK